MQLVYAEPALETAAPINKPMRQTLFFIGLAAFGFLILTLAIARHDPQGIVYGALTLLLGAFGVLFLILSRRNSRLLIGSGQFGYQDAFGRRHVWFASEVGAVLEMSVTYNKSTPPRRAIYVLDLNGRRLVVVSAAAFRDSAIAHFVSATGKPVEVIPEVVAVRDFYARYPNAVGWMGRHSMLAGLMLALGLGAIVLLLILVVTALSHQ